MLFRFPTPRLRAVFTVLLLVAGLLSAPAVPGFGTATAAAQSGAVWEQLGGDIDGEAEGDHAGEAVAMSADGYTVIVGDPLDDGNGSNAGRARVYDFDGAAWVQRGASIDGQAADDFFGSAAGMSADGDTAIIGAPFNGPSAGHARVYDWDGTSWVQRGVDIEGEAAGDNAGEAVAMSADGDAVIIGAHGNGADGLQAGHARVYDWDGTTWVQRGADIDGEAAGDWSGTSVAMNAAGDTVVIGAPTNGGNGTWAGHARVYDWDGTTWVQRGADIDGEAAGDFAGLSVAMSADGDSVIVGAPLNDGNGLQSGQARVYDFDGAAWVQRGADIDGEAAGDRSANSVAMSADSNTVILGAPANGGNGAGAGHARIFDFDGVAWVQRGADIDGDAADSRAGESVALSADGNTVITGAPGHDGIASNSGLVRIYRAVAGDASPPVISASVTGGQGSNGWYTSDVQVTWAVTDPESAITSTSGCDPSAVTTDTTGTVLTCTATSAGGTGSASVIVKRDATAPTLVAVVNPNPVLQWLGATAIADANDATSSVSAESCGLVATTTLGTFDVSCSAADFAGNETTATVSYEVHDTSDAFEDVALALDLTATSNPTAAAAIANAANQVSQAIAKFDQGNELAGLRKIQRALEAIEDAEAADPSLELTNIKATLAAATKSQAITGIAAALATGTTNGFDLWKIAAAYNLVGTGDAQFIAGDYLGAATSYRRAYAKVRNIP